jgi:acyl-CoA synthetase (NDP forming)
MTFESLARDLCARALAEGRDTLLEPELYELLRAGGVATPDFVTVDPGRDVASQLRPVAGPRAVVKVVSPRITHKTEAGGVQVVPNDPAEIARAAAAMMATVRERCGAETASTVRGILVNGFIPSSEALGSQVFAGLRHSPDMGPVFALGLGGLETEELAARFQPGQATVLSSPSLSTPEATLAKFRRSYAYRRLTGKTREARAFTDDAALLGVIALFHRVAALSNTPGFGFTVLDFEVNPFLATGDRLVAVDAFLRFARGCTPEPAILHDQVATLLKPSTAAIMGASNKAVNPGRIILRNLLREQFPTGSIRAIHPEGGEIDGVTCCRSLADLPWTADLLVVAVGAKQVPGILDEVLATNAARSIVLIPGGMDETDEGKEIARQAREAIASERAAGRPAPVICGPNCLGIRSRPGRYDTLFIPESKLPLPEGRVGGLALVCQSGAYMITRMDNLPFLDPIYAISTGNQMDLTLVDFVEALDRDDEVGVVGLYIEGFKPLDGQRLARLVRRGREAGRDYIVYKAGRTAEGLGATASHTASISGDYVSCVGVLSDAGALIATTFEEFNMLLAMATLLRGKSFAGMRLAAISNAGFESVGMADNLSVSPRATLPQPAPATADRLRAVLAADRIDSLVNVRNPIDLTPMAPDRVYVEVLKAFLDDPQVDAAVVGIIPLTPAMQTLPPGADPKGRDTIDAPTSLVHQLPPVVKATSKPVVVTVDAGKLYDPMARALMAAGVPCFRSVDGAMRAFQKYLGYRVSGGVT